LTSAASTAASSSSRSTMDDDSGTRPSSPRPSADQAATPKA
jgi:hypothetical protein